MMAELEPIMKQNLPKAIRSRDNLYDYFISRARANLHLTLCFSPIGEKFRNRSLKFPGLISGCTMDWFQAWPEDARIGVSRHYLNEFPVVCTDRVKGELINMMSFVHNHVSDTCLVYYDRFRRQTFVTPKSLLSFLESYKMLYRDKYENIQTLAVRMQTGLSKLVEAAASVEILKTELIAKNVVIVEATAEAETVLADVKVSADAAEVIKTQVSAIKVDAEQLVSEIAIDTEIAMSKLAEAKPALDEAEAALNVSGVAVTVA